MGIDVNKSAFYACIERENEELKEKLQAKEQECEELHNRTASIIYRLTGGRLSYSTYTLEGCEDAYTDQLRIDVERATKELSEENEILKSENFTFEELIKTQEDEMDKLKQALGEIERFFDKRCDICRERNGIEESCDFCWKKDVKDIINNANTAPTTILKTQNIALQTMEFEEKKKYKKALKRIEHLVTHAFCLTIGTNKDTANLAQQIMRIVAKAKDGE